MKKKHLYRKNRIPFLTERGDTPGTKAVKSIGKRNWSSLILLLLFAVSTVSINSCGGKKGENTGKSGPVPVKTVKVERRNLYRFLELSGDITPWRTVEVVPNIGGELDTESARLQLKQAEAGLLIARANFHDAELNWKRMQNLKEQGSVSDQQYEKVKLAYEAASAKLKQAQAALDMAKYQLEVSIMKAPFDGIIASRNLNEGETINPMMMMQGSKGVVTLVDIKKVKIRVGIPDRYIKHMTYELPVSVRVDSYPGKEFNAVIHTISPAANPLSRTFDVEIAVDNEEMLLKPGMFARVRIALDEKKDVLAVPVDAIMKEDSGAYVFVVSGSSAKKRKIETGITQGELLEVKSGLEEGELVVTFGKKRLQDGTAVVINGGE